MKVAQKDVGFDSIRAAKVQWAQSILKVGPSSTTEEIEQAFKALKKARHQDTPGGTDADMQIAYEILRKGTNEN